MMEKKIVHDSEKCYCCKTCELVCSFHFNKEFRPSKSSISISRDHINGIWSWSIDDTCDLCENEIEPLCVKFCKYNAISISQDQKMEE